MKASDNFFEYIVNVIILKEATVKDHFCNNRLKIALLDFEMNMLSELAFAFVGVRLSDKLSHLLENMFSELEALAFVNLTESIDEEENKLFLISKGPFASLITEAFDWSHNVIVISEHLNSN